MAQEELKQCIALIQWRDVAKKANPVLELLMHIPNGGARSPQVGAMLKRIGTTKGVPDYLLPVARGAFSALWIEMKRPGGGTVSLEQRLFIEKLQQNCNRVVICDNWEKAKEEIECYLDLSVGSTCAKTQSTPRSG